MHVCTAYTGVYATYARAYSVYTCVYAVHVRVHGVSTCVYAVVASGSKAPKSDPLPSKNARRAEYSHHVEQAWGAYSLGYRAVWAAGAPLCGATLHLSDKKP